MKAICLYISKKNPLVACIKVTNGEDIIIATGWTLLTSPVAKGEEFTFSSDLVPVEEPITTATGIKYNKLKWVIKREVKNEEKKSSIVDKVELDRTNIDWNNAEKHHDATEFTYQLLDDDSGNVIELDKNNKEFTQALEIAQTTNRLMYLTGRAGTGKTTFLKYLKKKNKNTVVIAYTGVAAINAGGQTIHSFFQINPHDPPFIPNDNRLRFYTPTGDTDTRNIFNYFHYNRAKRELLKKLELLIIDEVSMVRADFIDIIDKLLRAFSGRDRKLPFGGVQVIFIGDAFQLPPIEGQE